MPTKLPLALLERRVEEKSGVLPAHRWNLHVLKGSSKQAGKLDSKREKLLKGNEGQVVIKFATLLK